MKRAGGVGTYELNLDIFFLSQIRLAVTVIQPVDFKEYLQPGGRTNHQINEAGTGHFNTSEKAVTVGQLSNKIGGDISRRASVRPCKVEGDIGGKITVCLDSGNFNLDLKVGRYLEKPVLTTLSQGLAKYLQGSGLYHGHSK
jgi:hypothetical protein